jgi:signal transduction histidine kinase
MFLAVTGATLTILIAGLAKSNHTQPLDLVSLATWGLGLTILNLFPVAGPKGVPFAADIPLGLSLSLIFPPPIVGLVCMLSAFDRREFCREVTLTKALYNRSQVSLAWFAASIVGHAQTLPSALSSRLVLLGTLSLLTQITANYLFIALPLGRVSGSGVRAVSRRFQVGTLADFGATYVALGILGITLAAAYPHFGPWAPLVFLVPAFLGRQALERSQRLIESLRAYRAREGALGELTQQVTQERSDERRLIAADLHDDVMQPLFKVTLMAQVLKHDLASGKLLELDQDVPALLEAAELASTALRDLIGDLRRSPLGTGGLVRALARLVEDARSASAADIRLDVHENVLMSEVQELAVYQIAREAIWNAAKHSDATCIVVTVRSAADALLLQVLDDGRGFDSSLPTEGHYGLAIMRERAIIAGGTLYIDSSPRGGTDVQASFPLAPTPAF